MHLITSPIRNFISTALNVSLSLGINYSTVHAATLSGAEYFIDATAPWCDSGPAPGSATALPPADGVWDAAVEAVNLTGIDPGQLAIGTHAVCVRFKSSTGLWGITRLATFNTGRGLAACEYYVDTDPGVGKGQNLPAEDGSFNSGTEILEKTGISATGLTLGTHKAYTRCRNEWEQWGEVKYAQFEVCDVLCGNVHCTTNPATNVTSTSATLNGSVISNRATATASFDFGTTTAYGTTVAAIPSSVYSSTAVAITGNKTGLNCNTTYHYRAKAVSSVGTGFGADKTFTTLATCGHTVTSSTNPVNSGTVAPNTPQLIAKNATASFTVTANRDYTRNNVVSGNCPQGNWTGNVWNTGPIIANCNVVFKFDPIPANSWLAPQNKNVLRDRSFTLDIIAKSDTMQISAYEFIVTFDATKLSLDQSLCNKGVCKGSSGLTTNQVAINTTNSAANTIKITGLANAGEETGPGNDLQLLTVNFKSRTTLGLTPVNLTTNKLENASGDSIGTNSRNATIDITTGICGDADGNATVNIIDALAISRKLVGLPPPPTIEPEWADVDKNGVVGIVDALHIARYSIGLQLPPGLCAIGMAL